MYVLTIMSSCVFFLSFHAQQVFLDSSLSLSIKELSEETGPDLLLILTRQISARI